MLAAGEGRNLEFKSGLSNDAKIARTLCAFANTRGGLLVVGVGDRGEVLGVARPNAIAARLEAICATSIEPPVEARVAQARVGGRALVYASVARSPAGPHAVVAADDAREVVVRVGSSNRRAEGATLRALRSAGRGAARGELERSILGWLERLDRGGNHPGGAAGVRDFARAHNIGMQRARAAFIRLEREGLIVGHGAGAGRRYARP